ncbi:minor capsid protein [Capybara microvirus Cap3_SP_562]|nr:minor capsid protein [Capybara microvirus Cap3_SP_562]
MSNIDLTSQQGSYDYLDNDSFGSMFGFDGNNSKTQQATFWQGINNWFTGNLDYQRELETLGFNQAYNAAEALKQRDYEKYMSNTAYQRAASDLEKAGYNPALIFGNGGASTPTTAAAHSTSSYSSRSSSVFDSFARILGTIIGSVVSANSASTVAAMNNETKTNIANLSNDTKTNIANLSNETKQRVAHTNGYYKISNTDAYFADKLEYDRIKKKEGLK